MEFEFNILNGKKYQTKIEQNEKNLMVTINSKNFCVTFNKISDNCYSILNGNKQFLTYFIKKDDKTFIFTNGEYFEIKKTDDSPLLSGQEDISREKHIKAPMPGRIVKVFAKTGNKVKKDQVLVVMESMKMELNLVSLNNGVIQKVNANVGSTVNIGDLLVEME